LRAYSSYKDIAKLIKKVDSIGLVPTMGSLHDGHLSLIKRALMDNKKVIVSIYVNPKQFNNFNDLKKYPRNLKNDLEKLEMFNNIIVYAPNDKDIYEEGEEKKKYYFGKIAQIMEGNSRPGHFEGVATIVEKLLRMFKPNNAYFGEKDFQQLLIVKALAVKIKIDVDIIGCETVREGDGLAMSSRNTFLDIAERKSASQIIKLLRKAKKMHKTYNLEDIKYYILKEANLIDNFQIEYFEVINIADFIEEVKEVRAFIACKVGNTRLIDNIRI
jgi:pantoate--beta-alanine ligase